VNVRYTADELGRISEAELVRREFDERNLGWARTVVVVFIFFLPFLTVVGTELEALTAEDTISFTRLPRRFVTSCCATSSRSAARRRRRTM
jgi:hypothetical protein